MVSMRLLFFLIFSFCSCKSLNFYENLSRQLKKIKVEIPPKEAYINLLSHLSVKSSRIFQGIVPLNDSSILYKKYSYSKEFAKFLESQTLSEDFKRTGMIEFNFTQQLKTLTLSQAVGVVYKVEDKLIVAIAEATTFAIPRRKNSTCRCKRFLFFKRCLKCLHQEVIRTFSTEQLAILKKLLKGYGYKELTRLVEQNKDLSIQIPN